MSQLADATYDGISQLMYSAVGLSFGENKRALVTSRLAPRIQRLGLDSFEEYLDLISNGQDGGEFQMAVDLLTTNETYFFREQPHFDLLQRELEAHRRPSLRLWSAASSFGDEAYSLAMMLSDMQMYGRIGNDWSILGTDISDRVLQSAVTAVYPVDRLRNVAPERLKRYCLRGEAESEGLVQMQQRLRDRVKFGQLNLCQPLGEVGEFDVIFLRNVLIYFDAQTKCEVVDRVLSALKPGGLFFIGIAEGRVPCTTPLAPLAPGAFRKVAS